VLGYEKAHSLTLEVKFPETEYGSAKYAASFFSAAAAALSFQYESNSVAWSRQYSSLSKILAFRVGIKTAKESRRKIFWHVAI